MSIKQTQVKKSAIQTSQVPLLSSNSNVAFLGNQQMPVRQLVAVAQPGGPKSRNPHGGKAQLRQGNSMGTKNGSFGNMSSKSPLTQKSINTGPKGAAPSNYAQNINISGSMAASASRGANGKPQSIVI